MEFKLFGVLINPNVQPNLPSSKAPIKPLEVVFYRNNELGEVPSKKRPRLIRFGDLIKPQVKRPRLEPPTPQNLPLRYRDFVFEKGADEGSLELVFVRRLTATDVDRHQARLSMPCKQVRQAFLKDEEKEFLKGTVEGGKRRLRNKLKVMVVDPSFKTHDMKLAKWNDDSADKSDDRRKSKSFWYALTNDWMKVLRDNGLTSGDAIQVWSFRIKGELGLVIHKIESGAGLSMSCAINDK